MPLHRERIRVLRPCNSLRPTTLRRPSAGETTLEYDLYHSTGQSAAPTTIEDTDASSSSARTPPRKARFTSRARYFAPNGPTYRQSLGLHGQRIRQRRPTRRLRLRRRFQDLHPRRVGPLLRSLRSRHHQRLQRLRLVALPPRPARSANSALNKPRDSRRKHAA